MDACKVMVLNEGPGMILESVFAVVQRSGVAMRVVDRSISYVGGGLDLCVRYAIY